MMKEIVHRNERNDQRKCFTLHYTHRIFLPIEDLNDLITLALNIVHV